VKTKAVNRRVSGKGEIPAPSSSALLELIPLGPVAEITLNVAAANLQAVVGVDVAVLPAVPGPEYALLPARNQYDAALIIKSLASCQGGAALKLGITRYDLCLPILTYVYGESQLGGRAAVVSLHRLRDKNQRVIYERAAKVGIHEVGHLLGLAHCRQADCLMRFSTQLAHLDRLPMHFCSACRYEVARRLLSIPNSPD
jgi:archaemetzincin